MNGYIIGCLLAVALIGTVIIAVISGSGNVERMTTLTGVYAVCKPDGYPAVCFANKSGGGFSCVQYAGECK